MARIIGTPKFTAFDSNGQLSGGKLYTYSAGTLTPVATYPTISDAVASTNANTNPVVLDSRGEADIVISGSTKFILKDSDDNTIWTVDNIVDATDNSFTELLDENSITIVDFAAITSAVNYVSISNATAGNPPVVTVAGTDTNIGLNINAKGSGTIAITGTTTITGDTAVTGALTTTGALSAASLTGSLLAAQADQETATSTSLVVSPGVQQYHPSAAKSWAQCTFAGTASKSYNVASVGDTGTGIVTINFTTDFSTAAYAVSAVSQLDNSSSAGTTVCTQVKNGSFAVGAVSLFCIVLSTYAPADASAIHFAAFGDQ